MGKFEHTVVGGPKVASIDTPTLSGHSYAAIS
jgi:hypothetical protein